MANNATKIKPDMRDLELSSYDYDLPPELIAMRPLERRDSSRLLVYKVKSDQVIHSSFDQIDKFLPSDSTLVVNRSKVFPCRLLGHKPTGGAAEVFVLSLTPEEGDFYPCLVKTRGKKIVGDLFHFADLKARVEKIKEDGSFLLSFDCDDLATILHELGNIPIPPYIRGGVSDERDIEDYQTLFAKDLGSVAAPTAGLHFTPKLFDRLQEQGVGLAEVTLHVGLGTFAMVKEEKIIDHNMHYEKYSIDQKNLEKISQAKSRIAVGTTSLRVLESAFSMDIDPEKVYDTNIFLYPGKEVHSIDGMVTNFHLPKSTLLMLVSAIVGREKTLQLYQEAIKERYRFFSYGDGMLILRNA